MPDVVLDNCVRDIVCGLSAGTLALLNSLIDGQKAVLLAQLSVIEAQILEFDVLALPLQVSAQAAQAALAVARQATTVIPLSLAAGCLQINDIGTTIRTSVDIVSADIRNIEADLTRILSFRAELQAVKAEIEGALNIFDSLQLVVEQCGT